MPRKTVHPTAAHTTHVVNGKYHDKGTRRKDVKARYSERTRGGGYSALFEVGAPVSVPTRILPGEYKTSLPSTRLSVKGYYRNATTGEVIR